MKTRFLLLLIILFYSISSKMKCDSDEVCISNLTSKYHCNKSTNVCEHESLSEFSKEYIIGIVIIVFISAFANAGGIGGGSVIVPVLTIMFAFEVNEAIPLSKATIFAGAVINVFFLLNQRNEFDMNKSLIDYRLCSFMLPIMMCGTFFGVYLNFIVPPMIIIMLLTGYLMLSIFSIHKKYKILSRREDKRLGTTLSKQVVEGLRRISRAFKRKEPPADIEDNDENMQQDMLAEDVSLGVRESKTANNHIEDFTRKFSSNNKSENCEKTTNEESEDSTNAGSELTNENEQKLKSKKPFSKMMRENMKFILILLSSIMIIMTLSLFKEGVFFSDKSQISRCSGLGISVMVIIASFCFMVSFLAFAFNIKKERMDLKQKLEAPCELKESRPSDEVPVLNMEQIESELRNQKMNIDSVFGQTEQNSTEILTSEQIDMNIKDQVKKKKVALLKLGSVSFMAGIGAGLLGIGGGMIINPFLIIMNYSPLDATAISSMGVLFTSTISTSEFLIMGAIRLSDLNYFLIFAGIGSLSGVFIIKGLIEKFQRQSILLLIILGIFIFAVIVLPGFGLLTIPIQNYFKFGSVCL